MNQDPYKYFRVEAAELLERIGQDLLGLDRGAPAPEFLPSLLRQLHTMKGAARVVKLGAIADIAHDMEELLQPVRGIDGPLEHTLIHALFGHLDTITSHVAGISGAESDAKPTPATKPSAVATQQATTPPSVDSPTPLTVTRTSVADVDALLNAISGTFAQLATLQPMRDQVEQLRSSVELLTRQLSSPVRDVSRQATQAIEGARATCRQVEDACRRIDRELDSGLGRMERELGDVYAAAEGLRLVPAANAFNVLERAARDTAHQLDRSIQFKARGGSVRLDGHVLAVAQEALLHAVRNGVAHGIEDSVTRTSLGKAPQGTITVEVMRRGRRAVFACQDDGRGVNVDAVRKAFQARGIANGKSASLDELLQLLPSAGVSTATEVTELSGRGVGLDVARDAAERLGGSIKLETWAGKGFRVELDVPLSMASFEGLVVESAGIVGALPIDAVEHTYRLQPGDITRRAEGEMVLHQGQLIPFVQLHELLGRPRQRQSTTYPTLVVRSAAGPAAIGVERLVGARTVVARALPDAAVTTRIVTGASLNTSGRPELVFDAESLATEARATRTVQMEKTPEQHRILVIDDSLTTRMLEQSILESAGYEVDVAKSAEEGLERARERPHSLFLVDVDMPGIDGFTFVERVRADAELRDTPAVLVTSRNQETDFARGRAVGASGYMVKGLFDQVELLALIRKLVRSA